ncbi:hypothetical protein AAVH_14129 [Aphelenchoides avenae]|nr:hypothetical protein AAVH_14129 [Aphelenchus avenae]
MSKLFVAVLAFSTVSLAVGHQGFSLGPFLDNPKIKLLSNPGKVKEVLKEHAPKLYQRVEAAEAAFAQIRDRIGRPDQKNFVAKVGEVIEKYYLVGLHINEQAKEGEELQKLYDGLADVAKDQVAEEIGGGGGKAVEEALYKH